VKDESGGLQWGPVVVTGISLTGPGPLPTRHPASMGSGRGDRNQATTSRTRNGPSTLQWGPVVVTGIRGTRKSGRLSVKRCASMGSGRGDRDRNQLTIQVEEAWSLVASMGSGRGDRNQKEHRCCECRRTMLQWGPVVVTGIRWNAGRGLDPTPSSRFNGVRSW